MLRHSFKNDMRLGGTKAINPFYRALAVTFSAYDTPLKASDLTSFKKTRPYLPWYNFLNPLNWLECIFALLYYFMVRLTEVGAVPSQSETIQSKIRIYYSNSRATFRTIICFPFYLIYLIVRVITSPVHTLLHRLVKMIKKHPGFFVTMMILGTLSGVGLVLFSFFNPGALVMPFIFPYIVAGINALTQFLGVQLLAVATMTLAGGVLGFAFTLAAMFGAARIFAAVKQTEKDDYTSAVFEPIKSGQTQQYENYLIDHPDEEVLPEFHKSPTGTDSRVRGNGTENKNDETLQQQTLEPFE